MCCFVNQLEEKREIILKLIFEDKMERELTSELKTGEPVTDVNFVTFNFLHHCPNICLNLTVEPDTHGT